MGSIVRRVAVALCIALAAVLLWFRRVDTPTVPVLVATRDIPAGAVIDGNAVTIERRRPGSAPIGVLTDPGDVRGRLATEEILQGEAIFPARLEPRTAARGREVSLRPGWRSVTIPFDAVTSLASLIQPGSHIDILAVGNSTPRATRIASVVVEDVRVLAVGDVREPTGRPIRASTLTIEVATDADADRLTKAAGNGRLQYLLRG